MLQGLPNLIHLGDDVRDFADTAAIISLLDVVVSVDTAVAHLAGAMGKPVVILLPHAADFRWMRDRDDTPWYPTAKLLRQPAFGDWDSVIACAADELRRSGSAVRISLTTSIYCLVRIAGRCPPLSEPSMTDRIHLVVATPCFGGQVSSIYASSIFRCSARCARCRTSSSRCCCATATR